MDSDQTPRNLRDMKFAEIKGIDITQWHEQEDGKGKPSQVHMLLELHGIDAILVMRFKGPVTITKVINGLIEHRDEVWPESAGKREETVEQLFKASQAALYAINSLLATREGITDELLRDIEAALDSALREA